MLNMRILSENPEKDSSATYEWLYISQMPACIHVCRKGFVDLFEQLRLSAYPLYERMSLCIIILKRHIRMFIYYKVIKDTDI